MHIDTVNQFEMTSNQHCIFECNVVFMLVENNFISFIFSIGRKNALIKFIMHIHMIVLHNFGVFMNSILHF